MARFVLHTHLSEAQRQALVPLLVTESLRETRGKVVCSAYSEMVNSIVSDGPIAFTVDGMSRSDKESLFKSIRSCFLGGSCQGHSFGPVKELLLAWERYTYGRSGAPTEALDISDYMFADSPDDGLWRYRP